MGLPKTHRSKIRQKNKRMHLHIASSTLVSCPKCGKPVLAHTLCQNCGTYRGKMLVDVMANLTKKEKKQKKRDENERRSWPNKPK